MEIDELGKLFGAAVAGALGGLAGLAKVPDKIKKGIADDESLALLRQRLETIQRDVSEAKESMKRLEERVAHSVSDEEFAAYTAQTSAAVTALTEKVGHTTGAIESWYRSKRMM
jgi:methyl-accepting chemotaxis protein